MLEVLVVVFLHLGFFGQSVRPWSAARNVSGDIQLPRHKPGSMGMSSAVYKLSLPDSKPNCHVHRRTRNK